jgi:hypothetical protein
MINTLVSLFWHPSKDNALHFGLPARMPQWYFYVGIVLISLGVALVLYAKEASEAPVRPVSAANQS